MGTATQSRPPHLVMRLQRLRTEWLSSWGWNLPCPWIKSRPLGIPPCTAKYNHPEGSVESALLRRGQIRGSTHHRGRPPLGFTWLSPPKPHSQTRELLRRARNQIKASACAKESVSRQNFSPRSWVRSSSCAIITMLGFRVRIPP